MGGDFGFGRVGRKAVGGNGRDARWAPDFGGAIEVDNEGNVNGVDVTMPGCS